MTPTHQLLARQLRRLGVAADEAILAPWDALVCQVDVAYQDYDQDRQLLERSLAISSEELRSLYDDLARSSASQLAIERDRLREINAVQRAVVEASPTGLVVISTRGMVQIFNRRFVEIFGLDSALVATWDQQTLLAAMARAIAEPTGFVVALAALTDSDEVLSRALVLHDGRLLEASAYPVNDASGSPCGRVWRFLDTTARQREEQRLQDAHAFLDSVIETIPSVVVVKDAATLQIIGINRAGEQRLGLARQAVIGKTDADLYPPEQAAMLADADRLALGNPDVTTAPDVPLTTARGSRYVRVRRTRICDTAGAPRYLLAVADDTTEERAHEAELFLAKEHAERASRAKSDFLLNMSHELRTPLNAILGFARVLERTAKDRLTTDERAYFADIVAAGGHMLQLVNDLLDLRSLDAIGLDITPVDLLGTIDEAVKMTTPLIGERTQQLVHEIVEPIPRALGDRRAIVQVLVNLLTNAIKFTPEGGQITVGVVADGPMVTLYVRDTGPGIAPADQARLFVYFEQLGAKHASQMRGSGIGLALTRALIERMGGSIAVASAPGAGATFTVSLRAA